MHILTGVKVQKVARAYAEIEMHMSKNLLPQNSIEMSLNSLKLLPL
jgi:hypothetical protein